jgi:hypothetical protein
MEETTQREHIDAASPIGVDLVETLTSFGTKHCPSPLFV